MVLWSGLGLLGAIVAYLLISYLIGDIGQGVALVSNAVAIMITGVVLYALGIVFRNHADKFSAKLEAEEKLTKTRRVKTAVVDSLGINRAHRPSIFFIPLHFWGIIFVAYGVYEGVMKGF